MRWGLPVLFAVFIFIFILLSVLDYTDTIKSDIEVYNSGGNLKIYAFVNENDWSFVKDNQKIIIHLNSYPDYEYGILEGRIAEIKNVPLKNGKYQISIDLSSDFGNYNNFFNANMHKGYGEIIIGSTTVLNKILKF